MHAATGLNNEFWSNITPNLYRGPTHLKLKQLNSNATVSQVRIPFVGSWIQNKRRCFKLKCFIKSNHKLGSQSDLIWNGVDKKSQTNWVQPQWHFFAFLRRIDSPFLKDFLINWPEMAVYIARVSSVCTRSEVCVACHAQLVWPGFPF